MPSDTLVCPAAPRTRLSAWRSGWDMFACASCVSPDTLDLPCQSCCYSNRKLASGLYRVRPCMDHEASHPHGGYCNINSSNRMPWSFGLGFGGPEICITMAVLQRRRPCAWYHYGNVATSHMYCVYLHASQSWPCITIAQ